MTAQGTLAMVLCVGLGACGFAVEDLDTVPEQPTYEGHIKPWLADHCLHCHGETPARGAPGYFRLDRYGDENGVAGAKTMANASLWAMEGESMPPAAERGDGVGPNGLAMFSLWIELGRPE